MFTTHLFRRQYIIKKYCDSIDGVLITVHKRIKMELVVSSIQGGPFLLLKHKLKRLIRFCDPNSTTYTYLDQVT